MTLLAWTGITLAFVLAIGGVVLWLLNRGKSMRNGKDANDQYINGKKARLNDARRDSYRETIDGVGGR